MDVRINFVYLSFLPLFCIFLSNCSSSQQGEEQLETSEYQEEGEQYDQGYDDDYGGEGGYGNNNGGATNGQGNNYGAQGNDYGAQVPENGANNSYNLGNDLNEDSYGFDNAQGDDIDAGQGGDNLNYPADDLEASFGSENEAGDAGNAGGAPAEIPDYGGGGGARVVRFVVADGVNVYSEASTSAEVVTSLSKGHPLVVVDMGEWSQIANNRYVKTENLSAKIVPRHMQPAEWYAP